MPDAGRGARAGSLNHHATARTKQQSWPPMATPNNTTDRQTQNTTTQQRSVHWRTGLPLLPPHQRIVGPGGLSTIQRDGEGSRSGQPLVLHQPRPPPTTAVINRTLACSVTSLLSSCRPSITRHATATNQCVLLGPSRNAGDVLGRKNRNHQSGCLCTLHTHTHTLRSSAIDSKAMPAARQPQIQGSLY